MGRRGPGLAKLEQLLENLKREINLTSLTTLKNAKIAESAEDGGFAVAKLAVTDATAPDTDETFTLVDFAGTSHVFTFKRTDNVVTNNNVGINTARGTNEAAVATQIAASINDATATTSGKITAVVDGDNVIIKQSTAGTAGNRTNSESTDGMTLGNFLGGAGYGLGALSTEVAPKSFIQTIGGDIITTIEVDLTGLKSKNDVGDVIGVASTAGAYIAEVSDAVNGIIYKVEMSCLELPTASSNVGLDIDIASAADPTSDYDDDLSAANVVLAMGGNSAKGTNFTGLTPTITSGHYLYLLTGATHTGDSVYTGGKFAIRLYGRATF